MCVCVSWLPVVDYMVWLALTGLYIPSLPSPPSFCWSILFLLLHCVGVQRCWRNQWILHQCDSTTTAPWGLLTMNSLPMRFSLFSAWKTLDSEFCTEEWILHQCDSATSSAGLFTVKFLPVWLVYRWQGLFHWCDSASGGVLTIWILHQCKSGVSVSGGVFTVDCLPVWLRCFCTWSSVDNELSANVTQVFLHLEECLTMNYLPIWRKCFCTWRSVDNELSTNVTQVF